MKTNILPSLSCGLSRWMICFLAVLSISLLQAQQENIQCNEKNPWIPENFVVDEQHSDTLKSFWQNGGHVPENLVNNNPNDFARAHIKQTGWAKVRIFDTDPEVVYEANNYVGFLIQSNAFKDGEFSSVTISTYLNGELRESYTGQDLVAYSPEFLKDPIEMGFVTTMTYNQVELIIDTSLGMALYDVYYAQVESFCAAEEPACNEVLALNNPDYPMTINYLLAGSSNAGAGYVDNPLGAISASITDYASLVNQANVAGKTFISMQNQFSDFSAGTFLGFDLVNTALISSDLLEYLSISTYLNGVMQDSVSSAGLLIGANLDAGDGRQTVGIITTSNADEVRLTVNQTLALNLGTTRVYSGVIERPCAGTPLGCNVSTTLDNPSHPVMISADHTGISGAACATCDVRNAGNVIDEDTTNYASIIVSAGVNASGNLSVKNVLEDYPAGTFAGYYIENEAVAEATILSNLSITTFLNGVQQETETGTDALLNIDSDLLLNTDQRLIGFVTTEPFDEVRLRVFNTLNVDIGTTLVYSIVIDSLCEGTIGCDSTFWMIRPDFPVVIDASLTGVDGAACAACDVNNTDAVLSADQDDYATIEITAGASASGSIAVMDPVATFPAGIRVGFAIEDVNALIEADLFNSLTISTYNDGVLQEFANGVDLFDISFSNTWIEPGSGIYNVGFETALAFDEVQITVGAVAGVNNEINVFGLFLDLEDITDPVLCGLLPVQWLSFDVRKTERTSTLSWTTAREFNNAGYEVQRSPDGRFFTTIGNVRPGVASVRDIYNYKYTDMMPINGVNYYRIRQVDIDGREQYSAILSLVFSNDVTTAFWPNPVNDRLHIQFASPVGAGDVTVLNASGMVMQQVAFGEKDEQVWIDFHTLNPGYYHIIIQSPQFRQVEKIAVLR